MKNLFTLFFLISAVIISSNLSAQGLSCPSVDEMQVKLDKMKEIAKKNCGSSEFFSGDSSDYDIDWTDKDKSNPHKETKLTNALGSQKCGYLLTACTSGTSIKVTLFVDYIRDGSEQTFLGNFSGDVASSMNTEAGSMKSIKLANGDGSLVWSYGPDTEKRFSKSINKFKFVFAKEGIIVNIFESFFYQSKKFKFQAGVNSVARQEILMPMPDEEEDDESKSEEKINSAIDSKASMPEKLESIGYAYVFMFLNVGKGEASEPFDASALKPHGVNLENLEDFPKDKKILMAYMGVVVLSDHIELDVFALLTDADGKKVDIYDFTHPMYSVQITAKGGLTSEKGSLDDLMLIYEMEKFSDTKRSILAQRKATKGGMDVIDIADGTAKRFSGNPWVAEVASALHFKASGTKVDFNSVFRKVNPTSALNLTDDVSGLKKTFLKGAINRAQKRWVNELLGK